MGFLDKAKKLADQAKEMAQDAIDDVKAKQQASKQGDATTSTPADARLGTAYVPGMLGRPGWREEGLADPAAVLPADERDRVGVPRGTKSEIVEEPFGMGRRWTAGDRSAALFYQLYPDQQAWDPPGGTTPSTDSTTAKTAALPDGRALTFLGGGKHPVVLEVKGVAAEDQTSLARAVAERLS